MIEGVDVAGYQATTFATSGRDFVFIKATEGSTFTNPHLSGQLDTARKAGMVVGFYHFQRTGNTQAQVDYFVKTVMPLLKSGDILVLDWEQHGLITAEKDAWLKAVKKKFPAHKVILYTYVSMWHNVDNDSFVQDGLWIADPNSPKGHPAIQHPWLFQQYSSAGGIDHNVGNFATKADLVKWCTPPKPVPTYAPFPGTTFFRIGRKSPVISAMSTRLVQSGYKGYVEKVHNGIWDEGDRKAYAWWQRKLGYSGSSADGIPGKASWDKLKVPHS